MVSCATSEIPDIWLNTYDPYKDVCYGVTTLSQKERELPPNACKRGLIIFSEDFVILKNSQYKNCINSKKCKQSVEVADDLMLTIDKAFYDVFGKSKTPLKGQ